MPHSTAPHANPNTTMSRSKPLQTGPMTTRAVSGYREISLRRSLPTTIAPCILIVGRISGATFTTNPPESARAGQPLASATAHACTASPSPSWGGTRKAAQLGTNGSAESEGQTPDPPRRVSGRAQSESTLSPHRSVSFVTAHCAYPGPSSFAPIARRLIDGRGLRISAGTTANPSVVTVPTTKHRTARARVDIGQFVRS